MRLSVSGFAIGPHAFKRNGPERNEMERRSDYLRESLACFRKHRPESRFLEGYEYAHKLWLRMIEDARCENVLIEERIAYIRKIYDPAFSSGFESGIEDVFEYDE